MLIEGLLHKGRLNLRGTFTKSICDVMLSKLWMQQSAVRRAFLVWGWHSSTAWAKIRSMMSCALQKVPQVMTTWSHGGNKLTECSALSLGQKNQINEEPFIYPADEVSYRCARQEVTGTGSHRQPHLNKTQRINLIYEYWLCTFNIYNWHTYEAVYIHMWNRR